MLRGIRHNLSFVRPPTYGRWSAAAPSALPDRRAIEDRSQRRAAPVVHWRGFAAKKAKNKKVVAKKTPMKRGQKPEVEKDDKETTAFFLQLIQAPKKERTEPLSEEEKERRKEVARTYSRMKFKEDVERKRVRTLRAVLMESAIEALPTEALRKEALTPDYTPFPLFRHAPFWTPPTEAREGGKIK